MTELNAAPSEEFVLHCDIPTCGAQLSMVGGVDRGEHGWGRLTYYNHQGVPRGVDDFDLCSVHNQEVKRVLGL